MNKSRTHQISVFTSATLSSKHLVPNWIERLQVDWEIEESDEQWATQLLDSSCRAAFWCMCRVLGTAIECVAAHACRVLERYLAVKLRSDITTMMDDGDVDEGKWEQFKDNFADKMPLLIASSVQIAAKMKCAGAQLTAQKVRTSLLGIGLIYSIDQVIASEYDVFQTIGFRLPMWTSIEIAELLALQMGLSPNLLRVVALCVELAEYYRHWLEQQVRWAADMLDTNGVNPVRTLHLCAGAVACAVRLTTCRVNEQLVEKLADVTQAPTLLIGCVADCLVALLLHDEGSSDTSVTSDSSSHGYAERLVVVPPQSYVGYCSVVQSSTYNQPLRLRTPHRSTPPFSVLPHYVNRLGSMDLSSVVLAAVPETCLHTDAILGWNVNAPR